jgi:hypothetical protein
MYNVRKGKSQSAKEWYDLIQRFNSGQMTEAEFFEYRDLSERYPKWFATGRQTDSPDSRYRR